MPRSTNYKTARSPIVTAQLSTGLLNPPQSGLLNPPQSGLLNPPQSGGDWGHHRAGGQSMFAARAVVHPHRPRNEETRPPGGCPPRRRRRRRRPQRHPLQAQGAVGSGMGACAVLAANMDYPPTRWPQITSDCGGQKEVNWSGLQCVRGSAASAQEGGKCEPRGAVSGLGACTVIAANMDYPSTRWP